MMREGQMHCRRSIRLREYDYSQEGAYFVTVCTRSRILWLGIREISEIVEKQWCWLAERYGRVELDEFVMMPNHIHGIFVLVDDRRGGSGTALRKRKPLGRLVGAFKTTSAKSIHDSGYRSFAWQRNYYERVIRNEDELNRIREYIIANPLQWELDRENADSANYNMDYNLYMDGVYAGGSRTAPTKPAAPAGEGTGWLG
jgi:REP element-mobilizing transposase RayT